MRIPKLNEVKYYSTFRDMVDGLSLRNEDKAAISWFTRKGEEIGVDYGRFYSDVRSLANALASRGYSGRHVAVLGENSYEWLLVYFACAYCGAVTVCIDVEQPDETIVQMLTMADTDVMFAASPFVDICRKYSAGSKPVFTLNGAGSESLVTLIAEGETAAVELPVLSGDSIASIVFTSGTTSFSKPVLLSHEAILTNASDALANVAIGKVAFTSLPFYHTYGLTCSVLSMLIGGAKLYINGNLKTVMRDIHLAKPHTMLTVPLMLETIHRNLWQNAEETGKASGLRKLLKLRGFTKALGFKKCCKTLAAIREKCFGEIRLIICGGAHMDPDITEEFALLGVDVVQGYGITECAPLVSVNRNRANKPRSVGLVTPNCEVRLVDGEIFVRGKNLMSGYYNSPEMTAEVMEDGWFKTGDIGEIDRDGFLYITGRKKNLIVFKNGKKLSPEKLEEKIRSFSLVKDVVVYGAVNGMSTDDVQVAASIYPDEEKAKGLDSYQILEELQNKIVELNRELPLYQQIQMVTIRENAFEKTSLQKVKRHLM